MSEMKEGEKFIFKDGKLVRFEEVEEKTKWKIGLRMIQYTFL